jgi:nicotinamide-nucleotide amidase
MQAEIIAIGDEMTSGQRLDTNSPWLSQRLAELGIPVRLMTTVGDDLAANIEAFRGARDRGDVVIATGGLGPTADDLTRDALAALLEVPLEENAEALAHIQQLFAARGRAMPPRNRLQALHPVGTRLIANPHGTAPGIHAEIPRPGGGVCHLFALPGVPAEMYEMWHQSVAPAIARLQTAPGVLQHRVIKIFGLGESDVEALFPDLIARERFPRVGITASGATISLRIAAWGVDEEACQQALDSTTDEIYAAAAPFIFGQGELELEHVVLELLQARGATLATDESFTAGLLARWLSTADLQGNCYRGGLTRPTAAEPSALSRAREVRESFSSDFGLAVGESRDGEVEVAWHDGTAGASQQVQRGGHPEVEPLRIAKCALNLLRRALLSSQERAS